MTPPDVPECRRCPAFLFSVESLASGLCAGCRSGPPGRTVAGVYVHVPPKNPEPKEPAK